MLINEAVSGTAVKIHIKHCIFNYNGYFGEVIDVVDLELPSRYMEIVNGAGLLVEIAKCSNVNASILLKTPASLITMVVLVQEHIYILILLQTTLY